MIELQYDENVERTGAVLIPPRPWTPPPRTAEDTETGIRPHPPPSSPDPLCCFQGAPGETPRAFGAFLTFFQFGQSRSHKAAANNLGESLPAVKKWASQFGVERTPSPHNRRVQLTDAMRQDLPVTNENFILGSFNYPLVPLGVPSGEFK
jgi:hypothetical protein